MRETVRLLEVSVGSGGRENRSQLLGGGSEDAVRKRESDLVVL